jgi:hypothetical protein
MNKPLIALGHELDTGPEAFGELLPCNDLEGNAPALNERLAQDGYLFLRDFLDIDQVMSARQEILSRISERGGLRPETPLMDGISIEGPEGQVFSHDLARDNQALEAVLYSGLLRDFFELLLGGAIGHFDYTWFRAYAGGQQGTYPHCDRVYMGRGTPDLYTAWVPFGDVPLELGGLMILEGSHLLETERMRDYLESDVDKYCLDDENAADIVSGKIYLKWDGSLTDNPGELRAELGGRWLTTDYRAGDLVVFTMATVHGSLDNQGDRFRLSSDSRYQLAGEPVDERWMGENPSAHGPESKIGMIC